MLIEYEHFGRIGEPIPGIVESPLSPLIAYEYFSDGLVSKTEFAKLIRDEIENATLEYKRRVRNGIGPVWNMDEEEHMGENCMSWWNGSDGFHIVFKKPLFSDADKYVYATSLITFKRGENVELAAFYSQEEKSGTAEEGVELKVKFTNEKMSYKYDVIRTEKGSVGIQSNPE